jgi:2-polyprenyl-6-methoxyphenol hydroxylase-like FAD-dependent oxidoreductase
MRVAIIGGGPGGLYLAILLRSAGVAREVVVVERDLPDVSRGFGVVLSGPALHGLASGDPIVHQALLSSAVRWQDLVVRHRGRSLRCGGNDFAAIARRRLLELLRQRCLDLAIELRWGTEASPGDFASWDLVVAADGSRSNARQALATILRPTVRVSSTKFIWFATTARFEALTFLFERDPHGWFAVHAYPYEEGTSSFIVETDERTWKHAGLDRDAAGTASAAYVADLFREHLGGARILTGVSRWSSFHTVRCERWYHGNVVLLGDAAHTAHFSVGSGTRMAMEDALVLARALREHPSVAGALAGYEHERQADVGRIQRAASTSLAWWEGFATYAELLEPEQFAFHFLTRSARSDRSGLTLRDEAFVARVEAWFGGAPLGLPVPGPLSLPNRLVTLGGEHSQAALVLYREPPALPPKGAWGVLTRDGSVPAGATVALWEAASGAPPEQVGEAVRDLLHRHPLVAAGVVLAAPDAGDGLRAARWQAEAAVRAGARLIAVTGGEGGDAALNETLLREHARMRCQATVIAIVPDADPGWAATAVLSGRTDLVATRPGRLTLPAPAAPSCRPCPPG